MVFPGDTTVLVSCCVQRNALRFLVPPLLRSLAFENWKTATRKSACIEPLTVLPTSHAQTILDASAKSGGVHVWNVITGELLTSFTAHVHAVSTLAFTEDYMLLLTAGADATMHAIIHHRRRGAFHKLSGRHPPPPLQLTNIIQVPSTYSPVYWEILEGRLTAHPPHKYSSLNRWAQRFTRFLWHYTVQKIEEANSQQNQSLVGQDSVRTQLISLEPLDLTGWV